MVSLKLLPPETELETKKVLKQLLRSYRALAELKGYTDRFKENRLFLDALTINEAKDSCAMENIIATHQELLGAITQENCHVPEARDVLNYKLALWSGYEHVREKQALTTGMIMEIQQLVVANSSGIRKLPGNILRKESSAGELSYNGEKEMLFLLANLEKYLNEDCDFLDPLIKLGVILYQFPTIHPFYEGNGRTGRIVLVLYLILKELLSSPVLNYSNYFLRNKSSYFRLLQEVRFKGRWEEWILFILDGIEQTAEETLLYVKKLDCFVEQTAEEIRSSLPQIFTRDLVDLLFHDFFIKIADIEKGLNVSRRTASRYLSSLEDRGFLVSRKTGKEKIFFNPRYWKQSKWCNKAE